MRALTISSALQIAAGIVVLLAQTRLVRAM
jgi:hypothetical protein